MVTDIWLNPVTGAPTVLGYNQAVDEFPHKLISFIPSSIVEMDRIDNGGLLRRFLSTMDDEWESTYGKILALPDLYKPETCQLKALEHLRYNIGVGDNLNYIWGVLDELGKRRFVKNFVKFVTMRMTTVGILELFETMTGRPVELFDYFDYQWLLSGETSFAAETALGFEEEGFDPWLITEYHEAFGMTPDYANVHSFGSSTRYIFKINTAVEEILEHRDTIPEFIRVVHKPSLKSIVGAVATVGVNYYVYGPPGYYFEQGALYTSDVNDFNVGFEIDQYVYDICVVDNDETLNHDMCIALAKFSRASHERVYIRYYRLIELFDEDNFEWELNADSYIDTENKILVLK